MHDTIIEMPIIHTEITLPKYLNRLLKSKIKLKSNQYNPPKPSSAMNKIIQKRQV